MTVELFFKFVRLKMKTRLEYRGAFLMGVVGQIIGYGANYLILFLLLQRFESIQGWEWPDLALIYSVNVFTYAIGASFVFSPMVEMDSLITSGKFDNYLTKPLNPFSFLVAQNFNVGYIAHILISGSVMVWSVTQVDLVWSWGRAIYFICIIISSSLLQASFLVLIGVWGFVFVRSQYLLGLYFKLKEFISYPISLYNIVMQVILTVVIPLGFINYYPGLFLLSRDVGTVQLCLGMLAPVVGPLFFLFTLWIWNKGLKKYEGAGG
ncbi:ABC transporter permease [Paenibacillus sp. MMS18-CY102]|uniref:ABC transporter permease n=1 Tax=Paenibacillus sp. MMS18-CY102 TaxID=2682849 RepID=UPI0013657036|nr:ABC-2 family transporter protein [Paenibacillus sp. MMS18-CY102]MWC30574.1 hypothetical protein [Paenibacillus sp. MMS18-CY102]